MAETFVTGETLLFVFGVLRICQLLPRLNTLLVLPFLLDGLLLFPRLLDSFLFCPKLCLKSSDSLWHFVNIGKGNVFLFLFVFHETKHFCIFYPESPALKNGRYRFRLHLLVIVNEVQTAHEVEHSIALPSGIFRLVKHGSGISGKQAVSNNRPTLKLGTELFRCFLFSDLTLLFSFFPFQFRQFFPCRLSLPDPAVDGTAHSLDAATFHRGS